MIKKIDPVEKILLKREKVPSSAFEEIRKHNFKNGKYLGQVLVEHGYIHVKSLLETLSDELGIAYIEAADFPKNEMPVSNIDISDTYLKDNIILPLKLEGETLTIAAFNPFDWNTFEDLKTTLGKNLNIQLCSQKDILEGIETYHGMGNSAMDRMVDDIQDDDFSTDHDESESAEHIRDMASEAPVIKLVNHIINHAIDTGASDIHLEPFNDELILRYRIDGVLCNFEAPPKRFQSAVTTRIKIMAHLDIAEKRLPQDGRIRIKSMGKDIDIRVSTLPTIYGESVVMRILDRGNILVELDKLGFPEKELGLFVNLIQQPYGKILVTGPTGSGKTTTLYAALDKINTVDKKIITIEDPVEYQLNGVNQIHVKPQIGLTFSNGLRSIVRQDPDVIMVGEIRDVETAKISIQSALTGHMVFSTVHTNDATGAVTRLQDMGIESFLITSALLGVLAQRLVRVICTNCKERQLLDSKILQELDGEDQQELVGYHGVGCDECNQTGYKGRTGIYELFVMNDAIRDLILAKANTQDLRNLARSSGMKTLREDGRKKMAEGITTVEEILRVTQREA